MRMLTSKEGIGEITLVERNTNFTLSAGAVLPHEENMIRMGLFGVTKAEWEVMAKIENISLTDILEAQ